MRVAARPSYVCDAAPGGGQRSCDKSVMFYISRLLPGFVGSWWNTVDTMRSYANAIPSDKSPFCIFQHSPLFPLIYSERVLAAHWSLPTSAPPIPHSPVSPLRQECLYLIAPALLIWKQPWHVDAGISLAKRKGRKLLCSVGGDVSITNKIIFHVVGTRASIFGCVIAFVKSEHFPGWMTPSTGIQTS